MCAQALVQRSFSEFNVSRVCKQRLPAVSKELLIDLIKQPLRGLVVLAGSPIWALVVRADHGAAAGPPNAWLCTCLAAYGNARDTSQLIAAHLCAPLCSHCTLRQGCL